MAKKGKRVDIRTFGLLAVGLLVFGGCAGGPRIIEKLRGFPVDNVEKFQLYLDQDTAIFAIDGESVAQVLIWGLQGKKGMYVTLPAGEHTLTLSRREWTGNTDYSGGKEYRQFDNIMITNDFLSNRVYDLWFTQNGNSLNYQFKFDKGEVSWANPREGETELLFSSAGKEQFFVYFDENAEYALVVENNDIRFFIPNGSHSVHVVEGRKFDEHSNRSATGYSDAKSEEISFVADGKRIRFRMKGRSLFDLLANKGPRLNIAR